MKKVFFFSLLLNAGVAFGQTGVGINLGNTPINDNAIVDMSKSTKGLLIPRLTQSARLNISRPANGLMLMDTSLNRSYQYQNDGWRYLLNNSFWSRSAFRSNHLFSLDSIGIGTTSPDARLEVNGNISVRSSLTADDDVIAGGILKSDDMTATGNIYIGGNTSVKGQIISQSLVIVDDASPIVQLKTGSVNKGFVQVSGDDLFLGTSTGNTTGKTIIRMDGRDIISIDTSANLSVLVGGTGGNITMARRLTRQVGPNENMMPILYGKVYGNGSQLWMSNNINSITNIGTGVYEIYASVRMSGRSSLLVTVTGTGPLIATAEYINALTFKVHVINALTGAPTNSDFNFIVLDPQNLLD